MLRHSVLVIMLLATATIGVAVAGCAPPPAESPENRREIVSNLAAELAANYVFPQVGAAYAQHLRSQSREWGGSPEDFAERLTAELQRVHKDTHLQIFPPDEQTDDAQSQPATSPPPTPNQTAAIEATEWLSPTIAYIRFNLFPGDRATLAELERFIERHAGASQLIVDLRGHRGGGLAEMDVLFPELFTEPTDLLVMETRQAVFELRGSPVGQRESMVRIDAPGELVREKHVVIPSSKPRFGATTVYVLISGYTASAAEHFALALKRTGRGVIVGSPSRGGAHFGGPLYIGGGYAAFIPVGRTYNPDDGSDWEYVGVTLDIAVTAADALVAALLEAGVTPAAAATINADLNYTAPPAPAREETIQ